MTKRSREDSSPPRPSSFSASSSPEPIPILAPPQTVTKIPHLEGKPSSDSSAMKCTLPPHRKPIDFESYASYEAHYRKEHMNRCLECRRNFPSEKWLGLHIEENHDAMWEVQKDRGEKMYSCFVEDCDKKTSTWQKRRLHCVDKHVFPKDFDFLIVNDGIDGRDSMLRSGGRGGGRYRKQYSSRHHAADGNNSQIRGTPPRAQKEAAEKDDVDMETDSKEEESTENGEEQPKSNADTKDDKTSDSDAKDMDGLSSAMSSLRFVPQSVSFGGRGRGRGLGRGGFSKN